jgi:hypothetical protein
MAEAPDVEDAAKSNRGVALLIALLALMLAFSELGGSNADNESIELNVEASNLWAFYQAKTVRRTSTLLAAEEMETRLVSETNPVARDAMEKRIAEWRKVADRYESEPETNEGRKELSTRALKAQKDREVQKAKGDIFDLSSALLQIGIVLCSATIITGVIALAWAAGVLGVIGGALMLFGAFAPLVIGGYL